MNYYIDITLLPDAEISLGFIWQKLFQQVHIALVDNKVGSNESAVALSFVDYGNKDFPLGSKLRLLADSEAALQKLDINRWLNRLTDYCHVKAIKPVPTDVTRYANFKRKAVKSLEKKAQRRAAHLNKPYDVVLAYLIKEGKSNDSKMPFINVESQETKKRVEEGTRTKFCLFIERAISDKPVAGTFDCYGLSKTATVPLF
ncbi:type I-F CRISPR-associated endoribonuclease Cas6/Csy4 [Aliikangiella sp. IMCC44653]